MLADPRRVKALFVAALDLPDEAARRDFLDRECGGDVGLRRRLEVLLQAHDRPDSALEGPLAGPAAAGTETGALESNGPPASGQPREAERPGALIAGRYKLLERVGEGGMGSVWMAEQREPVKRLVAVKLIKPGMDSRQVLARFEAERQALAMMDHPNIAKVLDGGTTERGAPFFVMELVKGIPLGEYCDGRQLTVRERLELFVAVCSAAQHAHQKGVIHRDLKPANVLVTEHDGRPVPKVIDFGLAKALHATNVLTERTLHTSFGAAVGTPLYMAPEQVGINALDVDTRTDVYALGVILYELLTGTTPLEKARLQEAAWDEVRRLIREDEPPRPSTRLSTSEALPSLAARRQTEPAKLSRLVRGELDWVVMKCLEKDRGRRYESAGGLAADVRRHLDGEPVLAVPPSAGYRARKFLRRHRGPAAAAAAIFLAVAGGGALAAWQAYRATQAEARALAERDEREQARQAEAEQRAAAVAEKVRAEAAEARARQEAAASRAVRDFLMTDLLRQADMVAQVETSQLAGLNFSAAVNPTVNELLDRAAAGLAADKIGTKFPGQPRVQAEILDTVGRTYLGVGQFAKAAEHLRRAADLFQASAGADDPSALGSLQSLAVAARAGGQTADAVALFGKVHAARVARLGPDDLATLETQLELGVTHMASGKDADGAALLESALSALNRSVGPDHKLALTAQVYLATARQKAGRLAEAIALAEAARDRGLRALPADHPYVLVGMGILGQLYHEAGRPADAIPALKAVVDLGTARHGADAPVVLHCLGLLSRAYQAAGQPDEALPCLRRTAESIRRTKGPADETAQISVNRLCLALSGAGRYDEAASVAREQVAAVREKAGPGSPAHQRALTSCGRVMMWQAGAPAGAEPILREALALRRAAGDTASGEYGGDLSGLGLLLLRQGRHADAEPVLRECLALRKRISPNLWMRFGTSFMLGWSLLGQGRRAEAEPLLREGYEGMKARHAIMHPIDDCRLTEAADRLAELYAATGRPAEAAALRAEQARYSRRPGPQPASQPAPNPAPQAAPAEARK